MATCFLCSHHETIIKCSEILRKDQIMVATIIRKVIEPTCIVNIDDDDVVCKTCLHLLKDFYQQYKRTKLLQRLLQQQVHRTYNIEVQTNVGLLTMEHALKAFYRNKSVTEGNSLGWQCKHCSYQTIHSDTIVPHFLYHNRDYDIGNEWLVDDDIDFNSVYQNDEYEEYEKRIDDQNLQIVEFVERNPDDDLESEFLELNPDDDMQSEFLELNPDDDLESEHQSDNENTTKSYHLNIVILADETNLKVTDEQKKKVESNECQDEIQQLPDIEKPTSNGEILNIENEFPCKDCQKNYSTKSDYVNHARSVHLNCVICKKMFRNKLAIKRHFRTAHSGKIITCDLCSRSFQTKIGLIKHFKWHRAKEIKQCLYCDRSFSKRTDHLAHVVQHTNTSNFTCKLCGKTFTSASTHRLHIRYHDNPKPFECKECPKAYASASSLAIHRRSAHTGKMLYRCEFCDKGLPSKGTYKTHRLKHVPDYPYNCAICPNKGFGRKRDFRRHMKNIHDDYSYFDVKVPEYKIAIRPSIEI